MNPRSLDALFNEDPDDLSEEETLVIMDALRKDRERFSAEPESKPKKASPVATVPKPKKVSASSTLSVDDLDI